MRISTNGRDEGRLAYIDSLRAIAAMLVLWTHTSQVFILAGRHAEASRWVYDLSIRIASGRLGVVTFFAISGFVIPFSIKLAHSHPVREFLVTRFFRLYPAYWLSVPLGFVLCEWLWGRPFSLGEFLVNLTMLETFFDVKPAIGLYWTLAVELVFYVSCIVLVLTGNMTNYRRIGAIVLILIAIHVLAVALTVRNGMSPWLGPTFWCLHIAIMFWGTLCRAHQRGDATSRFETFCVWGVAAFFIVIYPLLFTGLLGIDSGFTTGYSLGVLLFIVGTRFVRIEWRPLAWIGLVSYSIYLLHPVVHSPILHWLVHLPKDSWWRSWHLGFYVLSILLLTIGVSALVYYLLERPSIRLGRRLAAAWFDKTAPVTRPRLSTSESAA
jgi:peptidoglycan/LPS O-acetylase OafA/YrhL